MATYALSYLPCHKTISMSRHTRSHHKSFTINNRTSTNMKLGRKTTMSTAHPDPFRLGDVSLNGFGYRQRFDIRSYEVQTQYIAIQTIFNFLEETSWNYALMFWPHDAESGITRAMIKNNLRWVVSRMQVQIDEYPCWGDQLDIDTWVGAFGKNGMRRDWMLKSRDTGKVFARATSSWAMVNQKTQRVWKLPDEIKKEISHSFTQKQAIDEDFPEKLDKLKDNARYVISGLQPITRRLDVNHRVRKMTYVGWMLEAIPDECLRNYELSDIILEHRRECGISDIVQSLCEPEEVGTGEDGVSTEGSVEYRHLLQVEGELQYEEMVRGKTTWKKKARST